jgi:DNA-binding beta-propeller fold protein YncE
MAKSSRMLRPAAMILALLTLAAVAILVSPFQPGLAKTGRSNGSAQLMSVQRLPDVGDMCELMPPAGPLTLAAALQQRQEARLVSFQQRQTAQAAATSGRTQNRSTLKPVRWIKDPYAAYSSIAVDPVNNEVVVTDENLFQILVYDRTANTPPSAKFTEPKRVLAGLNTKIEFQCGLYIDPKNGDIYAVNNDTVDTLVIFNRQAKGDVPPTRELYTPHGSFGIAVDEKAEEMFMTMQHDSALVVFRKYAVKDEPPLRLLQGDKTGLADPHGLAVDSKNQLMFIANFGAVSSRHPRAANEAGRGRRAVKPNWPLERAQAIPGSGRNLPPSIIIHSLKAQGDVPPLRKIEGPKTRLNWPSGVSVDEDRGEIYVANDMDNSILVFNETDNGDVAPKRMIKGPKTMLANPTGIWVDLKNNEVWAANFMNHTATVYRRDATGDTAPLRVIRSGPTDEPALGIGNPHPVAYDSKREQILVPN